MSGASGVSRGSVRRKPRSCRHALHAGRNHIEISAPVSRDAKVLDGLNVQVAVRDEIASHKTSEVYDVLLTAMGKRRHPLLLSICAATGNTTGIGKQL